MDALTDKIETYFLAVPRFVQKFIVFGLYKQT
jgi:hypothetical protein